MLIKTSELTGAALDWAVGKAEGLADRLAPVNYCGKWEHGGPIIERVGIYLWRPYGFMGAWSAKLDDWQPERVVHDDKPLIAAMRCYVASELGDTVDIPDELR